MKTKQLISLAAVLGLVAGGAGAYLTSCPESNYPECYKQMVKTGFNAFDGVTYSANTNWQGGLADVEISSNILCPYNVQMSIFVKDKGKLDEKLNLEGTFENGKLSLKAIEVNPPQGGEVVLVLQAIERENANFDIVKILQKEQITSQTGVLHLR